ncbi:MAG: hypothetical protein KY469_15410 [Actinobacteria bacterium]|nr:hypothetical protein [Actinomycetota bacterium]
MTHDPRVTAAIVAATVVVALAAAASLNVFGVASGAAAWPQVLAETSWWLAWVPLVLAGAMVAVRRRELTIGWLMLAAGTSILLAAAAGQFGNAAIIGDPWRPDRIAFVEWLAVALDLGVPLLPLIVAHFPEGPGSDRRWRLLLRIGWGAFVVGAVSTAVTPSDTSKGIGEVAHFDNPWALDGLASAFGALEGLSFAILGLLAFGAIGRLAVRFRRAPLVERQQIKLFLFVVSLAVLMLFGGNWVGESVAFADDYVADLGFPVLVTGIAVAIGMAVTRHRLYDIDRLVSRTVAYTIVTGVLVVVYAGGVLGVGALVPGDRSDLLVAASTLVVAALFRPVRTRVQRFVDRRFNRARYDAARTVEAFGARLREEVDLGALRSELGTVVATTLQPAYVSVWLGGRGA